MKAPKPKGAAKFALRAARKRRQAETLARAQKDGSFKGRIRKNQRRTEYF